MTQQVAVLNHEPSSYMDLSIQVMHEMELGVLDDDHIRHRSRRQPIKHIFKVAMEPSSRQDHLVREIFRSNNNSSSRLCYSSESCVICMKEFKEGETCLALTTCNHFFHPDCIRQWLINNPICPLCRLSVSAV